MSVGLQARVFVMPKPDLGEIVYWYPDADKGQGPHVGIVTSIGHGNIGLNLVEPNTYNMPIVPDARHVDDPDFKAGERADAGGWDFHPMRKRIEKLESIVAKLMDKGR